uniref:Orf2 protein n=1 Tax=Kudoa hexapunctata TaxID=1450334 RepID=A0A0H5AY46_9CNID|nr:orf2 protein [Kudoa hexapunctata]BAR94706.1 orf2 protein [Kudoa hexapunctata]
MIAWILWSFLITFLFWGINHRIYWRMWSTSGWIIPALVEGSSLGSRGNHGLSCHMALFQGALLRSDFLLLLLESSSLSSSLFHGILVIFSYFLMTFTMKSPI